ncbi:MAG: ABC transporter ATP-binding protein, partial [Verrucomicrobia bacterium]|nr:ABC transporter ATP-binding protein [Verrucomicrobiota bacterium]
MTGGTVQDFLVIDQITKSFDVTRAVDSVSITVQEGEIFSLLGPSGCGKTTLLRLLAGFVKPDSGRLILNGADITDLPPEKRPVNTVFQNYALFPHLTVRENIAFGLQMAGRSRAYIGHAVEDMLTLVKLQEHIHHLPAQLSGGQKQRVAIARALVNKPQVLLLDEPLAALDLKLRQHMLSELSAIHREVGTTFIYVTHDQGEALSLSDRIAVLNQGRVEQLDTPTALYEKPINEFVAGFIGDANLLLGIVRDSSEDHLLRIEVAGFGDVFVQASTKVESGNRVTLVLRPEHLHCQTGSCEKGQGLNTFPARVEEVIYGGSQERLRLKSSALLL